MYTAEILRARGNSREALILVQTVSKSHLTNKRTAIAYRAKHIHCQNHSAEISHPLEPTDHRCSFPKHTLIPHTDREKHQTTSSLSLQPQLASPRGELDKQSTKSSSKFDVLAHGRRSEIQMKNMKTHSSTGALRCGRVKGEMVLSQ